MMAIQGNQKTRFCFWSWLVLASVFAFDQAYAQDITHPLSSVITSDLHQASTLDSQQQETPVDIEPSDSSEPKESTAAPSIFSLSLEELLNLTVVLATGQEGKWWTSAAASFVITQEDIRRSGLRSLPELFRMVPGLQVAREGSHRWAVTSRGLNGRYANKLLVQIDGRSVYDHLVGGVFWRVQDIPLDDVERIEVIRGPGASLWGDNAVNGVINIITKHTRDTQGLLLNLGGGTHNRVFGAFRYGGQFDDKTSFRVWGKYANYGRNQLLNGDQGIDDWDNGRSGFRLDHQLSDDTSLMIEIAGYGTAQAGLDQIITGRRIFEDRYHGTYFLTKLQNIREDKTGWSFQTYYDYLDHHQTDDRASNHNLIEGFRERRHVWDTDFRYHLRMDNHLISWGIGYRFVTDDFKPVQEFLPTGGIFVHVGLNPDRRDIHTVSGYIQDQITLVPDRLSLILGAKLEHNTLTDFEYQPTARLAWTPNDRQTIWGAISRSVRTSVRFAKDFTAAGLQIGNDGFQAEELISYELGYRRQLTDNLTIDIAGYYHDYDGIRNSRNAKFGNLTLAESYGCEAFMQWQVRDYWRLLMGYTFVRVNTMDTPDLRGNLESSDPRNQANIRSYLDITENLELNAAAYYVDSIAFNSEPAFHAPSYIRLDMGLTWKVSDDVEFSIWGQNLLDHRHLESVSINAESNVEIERSVYAQVKMRF